MKKTVLRVVSLLMMLTLLFSFSACGQKELLIRFVDKDGNDLDMQSILGGSGSGSGTGTGTGTAAKTGTGTGTAAGTGTGTAAAGATATTAAGGAAAVTNADGSAATTAAGAASGGAAASTSNLPTDAAGILALYTKVTNQFKSDAPGFKKVEYQELPTEYQNLGSLGNTLLKLAANYVTTKEKAEANPHIHNSGDTGDIHGCMPIYDNNAGCLLTDTSAIKSASCTDNGDGTATIVITTIDEVNAEPADKDATSSPSITGGIFAPISRKSVTDELAKISLITVNSFDLNYTDCTATVVYNTTDNHVSSWQQIMNVDITVDLKAGFIPLQGGARLVDSDIISDIAY